MQYLQNILTHILPHPLRNLSLRDASAILIQWTNPSLRRLCISSYVITSLRDAHFCNNYTKIGFIITHSHPHFCLFITNQFSNFPSQRGLLLKHIPILIISFPPNSFLKSPTPPAPTAFSQTSQSQSMPSSYACQSCESFLPSPSAVLTESLSRNSQ